MAYSLQRESGKLRNAASRLRKKGYSAEAGKMMAASEMARMREPNIMTPEFRRAEGTTQMALRNAQLATTRPDFDYTRDIQPLRRQFFSASALLPAGQQDMVTSKFGPQMESIAQTSLKDQSIKRQMKAQDLAFQAAKRKFKEDKKQIKKQRKLEKALPDVGARLQRIINSADTYERKQQKILSETFANPKLYALPAAASAVGSSMAMLQGQQAIEKRDEDKQFDLNVLAARLGAPEAVDLIKRGELLSGLNALAEKVQKSEVDALKAKGYTTMKSDIRGRLDKFNSAVSELMKGEAFMLMPYQVASTLTGAMAQLLPGDPLIEEFKSLIKELNSKDEFKDDDPTLNKMYSLISRASQSLGPNTIMQPAKATTRESMGIPRR